MKPAVKLSYKDCRNVLQSANFAPEHEKAKMELVDELSEIYEGFYVYTPADLLELPEVAMYLN